MPKTIDNDIPYIDHSFGFRTAFSRATESIRAAHIEARSAPGGVGLVKLMGRHSGFIACYAALAKNDADFVLIPEVPFALDGEDGFLAHLRRTVRPSGHAVIVVAEGAGQEHLRGEPRRATPPATPRCGDIRRFLQQRITDDFAAHGREVNLKLLDPQLRDPQRAREPVRQRLLRPARPRRGPRGDGRADRGGRRPLARPVRAHPDRGGDQPPQHGRPRRGPVAVRARVDGPARPVDAADAGAGAVNGADGRRLRGQSTATITSDALMIAVT